MWCARFFSLTCTTPRTKDVWGHESCWESQARDSFQPDLHAAGDFYSALLGWSIDEAKRAAGSTEPLIARMDGKNVASIRKCPDGVPPMWLKHVRVENLTRAIAEVESTGVVH